MLAQILAEAPPPEVVSWLSVAAWIVVFVGGLLYIATSVKELRKPKEEPTQIPNPLIVQKGTKFVEETAFEKADKEAHGRISRERKEVDAVIKALAERLETDIGKLGNQVGKYNENAELRTGRINDRIDQVNDAITALPRQMLQLIRDAREI